VTNVGDDTVSVFNTGTVALEQTVAVAGMPYAVVVSDDRAYVSISSTSHDGVSVIDTNTHTVLATYPLAFSVTALAISPSGKRVYAGRIAPYQVDVAVIDTTAERVGTIEIASGAGIGIDAVKVDHTGKRVYVAVTDSRASRLVVVDAETDRVERTVWVGSPIRDLALADSTAYVLTSDRARGGAVSVIDMSTHQITDTIEIGGAPTQMALSSDGVRAYVVDYDHVAVLCPQSAEIVDRIAIDARPSCVAVSSAGDQLYVADYAGAVTVFSLSPSSEPA